MNTITVSITLIPPRYLFAFRLLAALLGATLVIPKRRERKEGT